MSAWTYAHRGAAYTYKYWLQVVPPHVFPGAVKGVYDLPVSDPYHAECALENFQSAIEMNPSYSWAHAFKACVYGIKALAKHKAFPDKKVSTKKARKSLLSAFVCDVEKRLQVDHPIAKLLNFEGEYAESVAVSTCALEKDPTDHFASYHLAVGLKHLGDPLAPEVIKHTLKMLQGHKNEIEVMIHRLNHLEGAPEEDDRLSDMLSRGLSVEALAILAFEPMRGNARERSEPLEQAVAQEPPSIQLPM